MIIVRFLLGLALIAVPLYFAYALRLHISGWLGKALMYVVLSVAMLAGLSYAAIVLNNVAFTLLVFLVMLLCSSLFIVLRAKGNLRTHLLPVVAASLVCVMLVSIFLIGFVGAHAALFDARYFIPVSAMLFIANIPALSKALHTYLSGIKYHDAIFLFLKGNGATDSEALAYFVRRAMKQSMMPSIHQMGSVGILTVPVMLYTLVMSGQDVLLAAGAQVLFFIAMVACSSLTCFVSLKLLQRNYFNITA